MHRLPPYRLPVTIDEAIERGYSGLSLHCYGCGKIVIASWNSIARVTQRRVLAEIKPRLRCRTCGQPPKTVRLEWEYRKGWTSPPYWEHVEF